jgi:hypothetical protein
MHPSGGAVHRLHRRSRTIKEKSACACRLDWRCRLTCQRTLDAQRIRNLSNTSGQHKALRLDERTGGFCHPPASVERRVSSSMLRCGLHHPVILPARACIFARGCKPLPRIGINPARSPRQSRPSSCYCRSLSPNCMPQRQLTDTTV